jgi:hypothetical protein
LTVLFTYQILSSPYSVRTWRRSDRNELLRREGRLEVTTQCVERVE